MTQAQSLLEQLRRRKVLRAGVLYGAAAFAVLEFADIAFPRTHTVRWDTNLRRR